MKFMKMSKLALGLAAVFAASGQAMATNVNQTENLGFLDNNTSTNFGSSFYFSNIGKGSFTDYVTFSITGATLTSVSTMNNLYNPNTAGSFVETLVNLSTNQVVATAVNSVLVAGRRGSAALYANAYIAPVELSYGNYELKFTSTTGALTGKGSFSGSISPVPEPSTGALLLSGVGLLGFIAARRSRNTGA